MILETNASCESSFISSVGMSRADSYLGYHNDPEFREQVSAEISKITNTIERVANAMGTEGRNALIPPPITTF